MTTPDPIAAFRPRPKPIIAILGCPACNGMGDGCKECAEQGWIVTEPPEPPIVYMTRARYDELREAQRPRTKSSPEAASAAPAPDCEVCANCGADTKTNCWFDPADGWCCSACGASDADNEGGY